MLKVSMIGNLGVDPEQKQVGEQSLCNLFVICSGKKDGESEAMNVSVWGKQADACYKYLDKGSKVYVEGRLQSYDKQDGSKGYSVVASTVEFLSSKSESGRLPNRVAASSSEPMPF
jgi:single-strand DNA-binding protein